jgi:hypothetical protein
MSLPLFPGLPKSAPDDLARCRKALVGFDKMYKMMEHDEWFTFDEGVRRYVFPHLTGGLARYKEKYEQLLLDCVENGGGECWPEDGLKELLTAKLARLERMRMKGEG